MAIGALSLAVATLGVPSPRAHANIISSGPPVHTGGGTTISNSGNGVGNTIRTQSGDSARVFGNGGNGGNSAGYTQR